MPARTRPKLLSVRGEIQHSERWCWAACSTMAINYLTSDERRHVTQAQLAAYAIRGVDSLSALQALSAAQHADVKTLIQQCATSPSLCDVYARPLLLGLRYRESGALSWTSVKQQITKKRPFIFSWHRRGDRDASGDLHFLVGIGYAETPARTVFVWDPWPARASDTTIRRRPKRISYATFKDPENDNGMYVEHGTDVFDLQLLKRTNRPRNIRKRRASQRASERATRRVVSFEHALQRAAAVQHRTDVLTPLPPLRGVEPEDDARSLATPFPLISLPFALIQNEGVDPADVLKPETHTVLYPVIAGDEVVDATLAFVSTGGWRMGGYANTEVARLAVERWQRLGEPALAYIVAVPSLSLFFMGQGFGDEAHLTPLVDDEDFHVGETVAARAVLAVLFERARR